VKTNVPPSTERRPSTRAVPPLTPLESEVESPADVASTGQGPGSRMNRIAERAHEIYQSRGGEDGRALEDWLQAEREIDTES
jgi:hypothetical protein